MKKLQVCLVAFLACGFFAKAQETEESKDAKEEILDYYDATADDLKESLDGLSEMQVDYKPVDSVWSALEVVEHIILTEAMMFQTMQETFAGPEAEDAADAQLEDEQVISMVTSREKKVKTFPALEPTDKYASIDEAWEAFEDQREDIKDYIKDADLDFRNYVFEMPFGKLDGFQMLEFAAGHTARHTAQIEDLKASEEFPQ